MNANECKCRFDAVKDLRNDEIDNRDDAYKAVAKLISDIDYWGFSAKLHGGGPTTAGSFAKGTYVAGSSDIDLVCVLSSVAPRDFECYRESFVRTLSSKLKRCEAQQSSGHSHYSEIVLQLVRPSVALSGPLRHQIPQVPPVT